VKEVAAKEDRPTSIAFKAERFSELRSVEQAREIRICTLDQVQVDDRKLIFAHKTNPRSFVGLRDETCATESHANAPAIGLAKWNCVWENRVALHSTAGAAYPCNRCVFVGMLINEISDLTHLINGQSSIPDHVRDHLTRRAQRWLHFVYRDPVRALIARLLSKTGVADKTGPIAILPHHIEHGERDGCSFYTVTAHAEPPAISDTTGNTLPQVVEPSHGISILSTPALTELIKIIVDNLANPQNT
jgi:hypothetical protein